MWRFKPVFVQALVSELAIEALKIAVLHRAARRDQEVPDAMALGPSHECPAGELRTVVGSNSQWITPEDGSAVQQPGGVLARDAPPR